MGNTAFPLQRFQQAGASTDAINTLQQAWALMSPEAQAAENEWIAQVSDSEILQIASFPSGGAAPVMSGSIVEVDAGALASGSPVTGVAPSSLLAVDASGDIVSGPLTQGVTNVSDKAEQLLALLTGPDPAVLSTSTSGAPTTGTWLTGQAIVDSTGVVWVCTAAGTPGTWSTSSGGDLGGVTVSGTPNGAGQAIISTSTTAASWQTLASGTSVDDVNISISSASGALAPDLSTGRVIVATQVGDITNWAPTNVPADTQTCFVLLVLTEDVTGDHQINLGSSVTWLTADGSGNPPAFTTTAKAINVIPLFTTNGGTSWIGESPLLLPELQAMFVPFGADLSSDTPGTVSSVLGGLTPVTRSVQAAVTFASTYSLALTTSDTLITGTLTASTAITLTGLAAGVRCRFWFKQDSTGDRVPTINGTTVNLSAGALAPGAVAKIDCDYDGTNLYVGST